MLLAPIFLAAGAVATSVLNARGRFAAAAARADRLQPRDHRGRRPAGAAVRGRRPRDRRRRWARSATSSSSCPRSRRLGARIRPAPRPRATRRPARRSRSWARGRSAWGRDADHVPRGDQPRLDARGGRDHRRSTFAFALLQIPIGVIGVPLGIVAAAVAVARGRPGRRGRVPAAARPRASCLLAYVMIPIAALAIVVADDVTRSCSTTAACRPGDAGYHERRPVGVPGRAHRALADRGAGPGVLRPPGHGDAGRRGDRRGRRQHHARARAGRAARGRAGLAAAIAIAAWVELTILVVLLRRRVPGLDLGAVTRVLVRTAIVAALAVLPRPSPSARCSSGPGRTMPRSCWCSSRLALATAAGAAVFVAGVARVADRGAADYRRGRDGPRPPAAAAHDRPRTPHRPHRRRGTARRDLPSRPIPPPGTPSSRRTPRGSYLQLTGWARVKAVNGWSARRLSIPAPPGCPPGHPGPPPPPRSAALGVRLRPARPRARPLGPGGHRAVHGRWPRRASGRPAGSATCGSTRRSSGTPARDEDGAVRAALRRAGWRPAPPIQPVVHAGHRPARPTRTPCGATCARSGASTSTRPGRAACASSTRGRSASASSTGSTARPRTGPGS